MLSQRREQVLEALVNEYIASAAPVGSRTLVEHYALDVSPATVRNELAGLEENGYVVSPHTSAGRMPTDTGYRAFVDSLLEQDDDSLSSIARAQLEDWADTEGDLVAGTCSMLARFTDSLAIVLSPAFDRLALARMSLIQLGSKRVLAVLVTREGQVLSCNIDFDAEVAQARLAALETLFNSIFSGHSTYDFLDESVTSLLNDMHDPAATAILSAVSGLIRNDGARRIRHSGIAELLSQPEFSQPSAAVHMASFAEDDLGLSSAVASLPEGSSKPIVSIGHENGASAPDSVSIVAKGYRAGSHEAHGFVAVIGPTRMDYRKALAAIMAASETLGESL